MKNIAQKKPGPHPENPLDIAIKLRIDKQTEQKIKFCMEKLNTTRSDILRKGVHDLYDRLHEK